MRNENDSQTFTDSHNNNTQSVVRNGAENALYCGSCQHTLLEEYFDGVRAHDDKLKQYCEISANTKAPGPLIMEPIDVVWLKKDIRLHDHGPLSLLAQSSPRECVILYLYEPDQVRSFSTS